MLQGGVCCNFLASQVLLTQPKETEIAVSRTATGCDTVAGRWRSDLLTGLIWIFFFCGELSGYIKGGKFLD